MNSLLLSLFLYTCQVMWTWLYVVRSLINSGVYVCAVGYVLQSNKQCGSLTVKWLDKKSDETEDCLPKLCLKWTQNSAEILFFYYLQTFTQFNIPSAWHVWAKPKAHCFCLEIFIQIQHNLQKFIIVLGDIGFWKPLRYF